MLVCYYQKLIAVIPYYDPGACGFRLSLVSLAEDVLSCLNIVIGNGNYCRHYIFRYF